MSRSGKIPKHITNKYGEHPRIWSYSNVSSLDSGCKWEYWLGRIKKEKGVDGIYGVLGGMAHSELEHYYNNEIKYEDMLEEFYKEWLVIETGDLKFSSDEEKNMKMSMNYKNNLIHFFKNHKPIESKTINELEFWVDVKDNVFVGYIDNISVDDDNNYVITDWKTSSYGDEYKGEGLKSHSHQLLLYAYALHKLKKIPLDKIKCRWCFLKYCVIDVDYKIKSKKDMQHKQYISERIKWVDKVKSQLKKDIIRYYPDITEMEQDILLEQSIAKNDLSLLCKEIQNNYKISDFYLYTDVSEDALNELEEYICNRINEIKSNESDEENWYREHPISYIDDRGKEINDSFYCSTLCGQRENCHYYKEYLDDLKTATQKIQDSNEVDLLAELDDLL